MVAAFGLPAPATATTAAASDHVVTGPTTASYIVTLRRGTSVPAILARHSGLEEPRRTYSRAIRGFATGLTPAEAARLRRDPGVADVELDGAMTTTGAQAWPAWGLDRIDQPGALLDNTYAYDGRGAGVTAYVVDTGVKRHREFGRRLARGRSVVGGSARRDCAGHGTHVAGTVAGATSGVAKRVRVVPVRVGRCGTFVRRSDLIAGLEYIVRHHRSGTPAVANISLGGAASTATDTAVRRVLRDGVTVVTAAGNAGINACRLSPARVRGVLTVGAVNGRDRAPDWSNHGRCVDLFAPGVGIRSAGTASFRALRTASGTSMAAPHVGGIVARYLARHPGASPAAVHRFVVGTARRGVVRNAGRGTSRSLVYWPGQVPTRLDAANGDVAMPWGARVAIGGRLVNRATSRVMPNRPVTLYGRAQGASTWQRIATATTDRYGDAILYRTVEHPMEFQVRHNATATSVTSQARPFSVKMMQAGTTLRIGVSSRSVGAGERVTVTGVLRRVSDGAPVRNRVVVMYWWVNFGAAVSESARTDENGVARFEHRPIGTTYYMLDHPEDDTTHYSSSEQVTVHVSTR